MNNPEVSNPRIAVLSLALSAAAFVGLISMEGYSDTAIIPVPGDVPTVGFGSTNGVTMTTRITPVEAVQRALQDSNKFQSTLKQCVKVPLHQYEYDAFVSLAYNIGPTAFCNSTLVKRLNSKDYSGACQEILKWDKFKGKPLAGLTARRQREYKECIGD